MYTTMLKPPGPFEYVDVARTTLDHTVAHVLSDVSRQECPTSSQHQNQRTASVEQHRILSVREIEKVERHRILRIAASPKRVFGPELLTVRGLAFRLDHYVFGQP